MFLVFILSLQIVKYSSSLIAKTKMSGSFVGIVLISFVTSIPELISQITQSAMGKPSIAIANDLGSNAMTTLVMGVVALFLFRKAFIQQIKNDSILLSIITLVITFSLSIALYFAKDMRIGKQGVFLIGMIPIVLLIIYIGVTIFFYYYGDGDELEVHNKYADKSGTILSISLFFVLFAVLLIIVSVILNWVVDATAYIYNVTPKSSGGLFLSITTTLPEATTFIVFVRRGHVSAGIGSILGSHIFNFAQIILGDFVYNKNTVISAQAEAHLWAVGIMLSIMLLFFTTFLLSRNKIKSNFSYFIFPIGIISTYLIGWTLMTVFLG